MSSAGLRELEPTRRPPGAWKLRPPFAARSVLYALLGSLLLAWSFARTELDRALSMSLEGAADLAGLAPQSEVGRGARRLIESSLPLVFARHTPINRLQNFDPHDLPWFSHIEHRTTSSKRFDANLSSLEQVTSSEAYLVEPLGYIGFVGVKMLESLEIALWGTLLAMAIGAPLAFFAARNYTPHPLLYWFSRAASSFCRAVPELVSALFLVLMFGFGPAAGVLALGLHSAGFFGKFYADDIENAERGPQQALLSIGAGKLRTLRYAVLSQVLPQYVAYTQYILERNVRMATVIGIVGAGGIGIELKGRFDMFDFGHVSTILLVIFLTVFLLERLSQAIRSRII